MEFRKIVMMTLYARQQTRHRYKEQALSALFCASNLDWSSISHMVIHMFQCYSLTSSLSHLLSHSPKGLSFTFVFFLLPCV